MDAEDALSFAYSENECGGRRQQRGFKPAKLSVPNIQFSNLKHIVISSQNQAFQSDDMGEEDDGTLVPTAPKAGCDKATGQAGEPSTHGTALANDLLCRCRSLLRELEQFNDFLKNAQSEVSRNPEEYGVDIKHFRASVQMELKSLEKVRAMLQFVLAGLLLQTLHDVIQFLKKNKA